MKKEQLQFFFDEVLGELGWNEETEATGIDPLAYVREEIKRLNNRSVPSSALYLAHAWNTVKDGGYLTKELIDNHSEIIRNNDLASKHIIQMAAGSGHYIERNNTLDIRAENQKNCPDCGGTGYLMDMEGNERECLYCQ